MTEDIAKYGMRFAYKKHTNAQNVQGQILKTHQEALMEIVLGSAILAEVLLGMFFTRRAASLQEESC